MPSASRSCGVISPAFALFTCNHRNRLTVERSVEASYLRGASLLHARRLPQLRRDQSRLCALHLRMLNKLADCQGD